MFNLISNPSARAATSHLNGARCFILAGSVLFAISLCVPLDGNDLGILALYISMMGPMFLFEDFGLSSLWFSTYTLVNISLISALFLSFSARLISHPFTSLLFIVVALYTLLTLFTESQFAKNPAIWFWIGSAVMIAIGMNMARLRSGA